MVHIPPLQYRKAFYSARPEDRFRIDWSYVGKRHAFISFEVPWEEPLEGNSLFLHWGVFSFENSTRTENIMGDADPHPYRISLYYNDFYDYVLIYTCYFVALFVANFWIFGWPIWPLIIVIEESYMIWVAVYCWGLLQYVEGQPNREAKDRNFTRDNFNELIRLWLSRDALWWTFIGIVSLWPANPLTLLIMWMLPVDDESHTRDGAGPIYDNFRDGPY